MFWLVKSDSERRIDTQFVGRRDHDDMRRLGAPNLTAASPTRGAKKQDFGIF
jgi:hypothetical protein